MLSSLIKVKIVLVISVALKKDCLPFLETNRWVVLTIIVIILVDSILLI